MTDSAQLLTSAEPTGDLIARLAETASGQQQPQQYDPGAPLIAVVRNDHDIQVIDREHLAHYPLRSRGEVVVHDAGSLALLFGRHADEGSTVYADITTGRFTVVINDDGGGGPGWRDHRLVWQLAHTDEWKAWTKFQGLHGQTEFAEFLEEHADEVVTPSGADLLDLASTFQARTNVDFKSSTRLDSGQVQLGYVETVEASAGRKGDIRIPQEFVVALTPYEGGDAYRVRARLRYRVRDGALAIGYRLHRLDVVLRVAFDEVLDGADGSSDDRTGVGLVQHLRSAADGFAPVVVRGAAPIATSARS